MSDTTILNVNGRFEAQLLANPEFKTEPGSVAALSCYSSAQADEAYARISSWPEYQKTPLHSLPAAASGLGLAGLYCKDESRRLGLASFKALGAVYACVYEASSYLEKRLGRPVSDLDLLAGKYGAELSDIFFICCTDGNHGFSVASAARRMGARAVIYIPRGVSAGREEALRQEGAEVVRIDGIYDEAYAAVENVAKQEPGALLISDSATSYYRDIPIRCMTGYSVMVREMCEGPLENIPSHVILPAGCGGMAAAVISAFHLFLGERTPRFIIVEPLNADCLFASVLAGRPTIVDGDLETIMGGLSCAAVSYVAWPTISAGASFFLRIGDNAAIAAMRMFASPKSGDTPIVAGETGAAGLAGLLAICDDPVARETVGLTPSSHVLVFNCEGATDIEAYIQLTAGD